MSRPSFPERHSGIVDIAPYLGRPPEPLLPMAPPAREPRSRIRDAGIFLIGVATLLAGAALLVVALRGGERQGPVVQAAARVPDKADATGSAKALPRIAEPPEASEDPAPEGTSVTPTETRVAPTENGAPAPERPSTATRPARRPAAPASSEEPAAAEEPEERTLDQLMDRAVAPSLPETPPRDEVARVLRALSDEVAGCRAEGMERTVVTTRVTLDGASGRVARAAVDGDLQWTPTGACIVRTLSAARFSPFERDRFEVQFPYRL